MNPSGPTPHLQASLERRILSGLAAEWRQAAQELPASHRRRMVKPVFSIRDMGVRLGRWFPDRGEIALSRRLVFDHPWDAVRDVLLHEMAHQLADEMPGGASERPHGPIFRSACRLLQADPRASGTYPTLRERIASGSVRKNDRLMLRIKKLLALAGSQNRHEAEAAMGKAHDLIRKYNVDPQKWEADREFVSLFLGPPALRHFREFYHLAGLLQEYYFVEGVWVSAWVVEKAKMGRVLEVSGTCANVRMAEYVHHFVIGFIDAQWRRFNDGRGMNRHRKTDFAVGVIEGFREKLDGRLKDPGAKGRASLVVASDPMLNRYLRRRYPRIRRFRSKRGHADASVVEEGMRRGRKMVIHRGIEERETTLRPRLPGGRNPSGR